MIKLYKLAEDLFGIEGTQIYYQYIRFYYYWLFVAVFLSTNLLYTSTLILVINYIDCKVGENTKTFMFTSSMFNESSFACNISAFEDLIITQLGIEKTDVCYSNWLTIW